MPPILPLRRKIRYLLETAVVYIFYGFFKVLPVDTASNLGGAIMRTLGPRLAASRKAERHIAFALPELDEQERKTAIQGMWENLGRVFAEYPHLDKLLDRIEVIGGHYLEDVRDSDKGSILVGGHFANWEAYAVVARKYEMPVHLVYRKPNNMYVDGILQRARFRAGAVSNVPKGADGARQMMRILKNKECIGALIDQKYNKGISVPFFGKGAMTAPAIVQMAMRFDCPIYPVQIERLKGCRFRVTIHPPVKIPELKDPDKAVSQSLLSIHQLFEEWIRQRPGQWLWLHRRWPKGEV